MSRTSNVKNQKRTKSSSATIESLLQNLDALEIRSGALPHSLKLSRVLLATLQRSRLPPGWGSDQDLARTIHEVCKRYFATLDSDKTEKLCSELEKLGASRRLRDLLNQLQRSRAQFLASATTQGFLSHTSKWLQVGIRQSLGAIFSADASSVSAEKLLELLYGNTRNNSLRDQRLRRARELSSMAIPTWQRTAMAHRRINRLMSRIDRDEALRNRVSAVAPWIIVASTRYAAAASADSPSSCAQGLIRTLHKENANNPHRAGRLGRASQLLEAKLSSVDGAKLFARYASRALEKGQRSQSALTRIKAALLDSPAFPGANPNPFFFDIDTLLARNFAGFSQLIDSMGVQASGEMGKYIFQAMMLARLAAGTASPVEDRKWLQGCLSALLDFFLRAKDDFEIRAAKFSSGNPQERKSEVFPESHLSSTTSAVYLRDQEERFAQLKKFGVDALVRSLLSLGEAKKEQNSRKASDQKEEQIDREAKFELTLQLLDQILHPSIDEGLRILFGQRHMINRFEMIPPSSLVVLDRARQTRRNGESPVAIDVEGSDERGALRLRRGSYVSAA